MKSIEKFAIIADDYTGAGDSGIPFSRAGRRIELLLPGEGFGEHLGKSSGVSLTTESRLMEAEHAAAAVADLIHQCQAAGFTQFFKKIDSTLRGNPGSEIEAALNATGRKAALICSAMPSTGRTCVDGCIYLHNIPLHQTQIGNDPFTPITTSSVIELLGRQTSLPAGSVTIGHVEAGGAVLGRHLRSLVDSGIRLIVADAVTDDHLLALAGQIHTADFLPAGAGGFAMALAEAQKVQEEDAGKGEEAHARGPILAVMGSLAEVSRRQAELACAAGHFRPFAIQLHHGRDDIDRALAQFLNPPAHKVPNMLLQMFGTARPNRVAKEEGERVARLLGDVAALICRRYPYRTVFSTGGSTSMAVAKALGIRSVSLVDEIMPGVVLGSCAAPDTDIEWFISKAGGFGDRHLLGKLAGMSTINYKGTDEDAQ